MCSFFRKVSEESNIFDLQFCWSSHGPLQHSEHIYRPRPNTSIQLQHIRKPPVFWENLLLHLGRACCIYRVNLCWKQRMPASFYNSAALYRKLTAFSKSSLKLSCSTILPFAFIFRIEWHIFLFKRKIKVKFSFAFQDCWWEQTKTFLSDKMGIHQGARGAFPFKFCIAFAQDPMILFCTD